MTLNELSKEKRDEFDAILSEWKQKVSEIPELTSTNRLSAKDPYRELEKIYLPQLQAIFIK